MNKNNQTMTLTGVKDLEKILKQIAPKHARNLMRATVQGIAVTVGKEARQNVPVLSGLAKRAIKVRRKRSPGDKPVSLVYVTREGDVDAFYWRFIEFGTLTQSETPFFRPAVKKTQANLDTLLVQQFGKKLEARLRREARKQKK